MVHKPVLLNEVMETLSPQDGKIYIDATFGGGGYSRKMLEMARCAVYAIDQDITVKEYFDELLQSFPGRLSLAISKFSRLREVMLSFGINRVDGIVFDLGTSAMQLADPSRGFSFMKSGSLDMRMCSSSQRNAALFVNTVLEKEMADIIYHYGGERRSRKVARAIVDARQKRKINSTEDLAEIIRSVVPRSRVHPIDPATRTFQAIRIWVNNELEELQAGLEAASKLLRVGGKILVTSFHSLEDRVVKQKFKSLCDMGFSLVNKKAIRPTDEEIRDNPRSRSGKLRAIVRVE
ncbi:S-adenosyl-methyltransferase [Anaplasma centrale str. Israel]|uniref:Ribosomal RNA small subunit methyltransferase H n=1 Tax=Anaplasma centrale (strain Israel) TaxID=574556 RepID=D1AUP7_ANACI|nr:16S rRNA (cytosine(1402)-N(4))-methyltransferase RsmH [Anaplasma centrale]ACZ49275.1 S-adenosyl-methyltransferase [Anaplasma centrale str. Israel]